MKQNSKAIIIVIICMVVYSVLVTMFAASRTKKENNEGNKTKETTPSEVDTTNDFDIVLSPKTIISHNEKKGWYDNPNLEYKNLRFSVYIDKEYNDYHSIVYADKWQMVNYDETVTDYNESFMAIYSTIKYNVIDIELKKLDSNNAKDITDYLDTKDVNYQYDKLVINYVYYDFNQDGVKDDVYFVSNVGLSDYSGFNKTFSFGFAKVLNQNITFYEDVANNVNATNMCLPSFTTIIKYDDKVHLITECSYKSNSKSKHMMYNFTDKQVTKLVETKAN